MLKGKYIRHFKKLYPIFLLRYDLQFNSVLASLLDRISQLGRDNYNEKVLNMLHRLDFNGFYTSAVDQFKSNPAFSRGETDA